MDERLQKYLGSRSTAGRTDRTFAKTSWQPDTTPDLPPAKTNSLNGKVRLVRQIYTIVIVILIGTLFGIGIDYVESTPQMYDPPISSRIVYNATVANVQQVGTFSVTASSLFFIAVSFVMTTLSVCMPSVLSVTPRFDIHRWIDYSITAPLMMLQIAAVSGVTDIASLLGIYGSMFGCIIIGAVIEWQCYKGVKLYGLAATAQLPFFFSWIPVFHAVHQADDLPDFVWVIIAALFCLFLVFPVIHTYALTRPSPLVGVMYLRVAMFYAIFGLVSKVSLAYMLYFGSKARGSGDNALGKVGAVLGGTLGAAIVLCVYALVRFTRA